MTRSEFRNALVFAVSLAALLFFAFPAPMMAQVVGATISGTVVDSSGAKMPGVDITIMNVGTGITTIHQHPGQREFSAYPTCSRETMRLKPPQRGSRRWFARESH